MSKKKDNNYKKRLKQLANPKYILEDCWSLDHSTATFLAPRLRHLADNPHSTPCGLTSKQWGKKLDTMATAFELALRVDYYDEVYRKEIDKGLKLFAKWFSHLWI